MSKNKAKKTFYQIMELVAASAFIYVLLTLVLLFLLEKQPSTFIYVSF